MSPRSGPLYAHPTGLFISSKACNYFLPKFLNQIFIFNLPKIITTFLYYRSMRLWIINLKQKHIKIKKMIFKLGENASWIPEASLLPGLHGNPLNYFQVSEHTLFLPTTRVLCMLVLSLEHSKYWSSFPVNIQYSRHSGRPEMRRWKNTPSLPSRALGHTGKTDMSTYKDNTHSCQPKFVQFLPT